MTNILALHYLVCSVVIYLLPLSISQINILRTRLLFLAFGPISPDSARSPNDASQ